MRRFTNIVERAQKHQKEEERNNDNAERNEAQLPLACLVPHKTVVSLIFLALVVLGITRQISKKDTLILLATDYTVVNKGYLVHDFRVTTLDIVLLYVRLVALLL